MKNTKVDLNNKNLLTLIIGIVVFSISGSIFSKINLSTDEIRREVFQIDNGFSTLLPAADNPNVYLKDGCSDKKSIEKYTNTTHNAAKHFSSKFHELSDKNIKNLYEVLRSDSRGNLVTFGSPSSNLVARIALGYKKIGGKGDGFSYAPRSGIKLAVRYELDAGIIKSSHDVEYRTLERNINDKIITLANWGIRFKNGSIQCPKVIGNNLTEDFLIISSLPNVFNKEALLSNQRVINFGGTHRAGTQAISILLDSDRFLRDLHGRIKKIQGERIEQPYWQALILIKGVNKNNRASEPLSLGEIMLVEEIKVDKKKLTHLINGNQKLLKSELTKRSCNNS